MVVVGKLEIIGAINDADISRGIGRVKGGMGELERNTKQALAPMQQLSMTSVALGTALGHVAVQGFNALNALASKAPVLAPTFAKMEVALLNLSNTAGRVLKPIFEAIATDLIPAISEAITNNEGTIGGFVNTVTEGIGDLSKALRGQLSEIENIVPKGGMMALGAAAGYALAGPTGLFIGAGLGYAAANALIPEVTAQTREDFGIFGESRTAFGELEKGFGMSGEEFRSQYGLVGGFGKVASDYGSFIVSAIFDTIEWIFSRSSNKDREMALPNGVSR
jgi:hypothetical protein